MKYKIIKLNDDDTITFTKTELEKLLDDVYEDGYADGQKNGSTWIRPMPTPTDPVPLSPNPNPIWVGPGTGTTSPTYTPGDPIIINCSENGTPLKANDKTVSHNLTDIPNFD